MQGTSAMNPLGFEALDGAIFLPFKVEALGWNLLQMYFHSQNLSKIYQLNFLLSALATQTGTKADTSPRRRAISFTMRELR